jgi:hypothetical protein
MKYLPPAQDSCGTVSYAIPNNVFDNQFVTRVDWTISPRHNFFGRYFIDGYQQPAFFFPNNILVTTASGNIERVQSFTMGEIYTISSNTINSAHATLLRRRNNRGYAANDINPTTLGINLSIGVPNGLQLSEGKFTIGGGTNSPAHFNDNTLAFEDEVTLVRGRHQIIFGGEFVRNQLNISNAYESNGTFTFNGTFSGTAGGGNVTGDQNLDFLKGTLSAFQQSKFQGNALRGNIPSLYVQDTFHATPRLTAVAGIRWSPEFLPVDYFNRGTVFSMSAFLANQVSTVYPNAPAGALFYGDKGVPRAFSKNSPWQFSPNVGVAYDPTGNGRWVIRAGAELIYDEVNFFTSQREQQNPPFSTAISQTQTSSSGPIQFSSPWAAGTLTTSPFPRPAIPGPSEPFFPQSQFIIMGDHFHPMYVMQWTASVQHQFGHGWQMQLDYIGNKSTHVPLGLPLSPATYVPGTWTASGGCSGVVVTGPYAGKTGKAGTNCSTTSNSSQRYYLTQLNPTAGNYYVGGGGGSVFIGDEGTANYNGLVVTVQHRLSSSFSLLTNYTYSKCLNEEDAQGDVAGTTVQNPFNPAGDYGPCGSDYRHVGNVVLIAKSNFHLGNRFTNAVVNNWELGPLTHITSGAPFTVTTGTDLSLTATGNDRPNIVPGVSPYVGTGIRSASTQAARGYITAAAFCGAANGTCPNPVTGGTFGNLGRNTLRGPSQVTFDAQLSRIFPIHESLNLTARIEAFNVLNHPNFKTPTANLSSSTFGQISGTSNDPRLFQGSIKFNF